MADARKRARRDAGSEEAAAAPAPRPDPAPAGEASAEPAAEAVAALPAVPAAPPAPMAAPPAAPAALPPTSTAPAVEPQPRTARIELPASGLAEDVLRQLEGPGEATLRSAGPELAESAAPGRIELPASGLAEEILGVAPRSAEPAVHEGAPRPQSPAQGAVSGGHSLSFFAAPAQEQRAVAEATEHLVTFYLDREEYGIDVRQVQEIRRISEITTVPRAPEYVRGVINLRGRILPVLDLKRKLALGEVESTRAARIVVVRVRDRVLGLLVDGASQVPKIPVSRIEPAPEEVFERGGDYIRGVAKLDDRLIILVDLERLLAHELKAPGAASAGPQPAAGGSALS